jgi:serine/threonine protein phosphatase 1
MLQRLPTDASQRASRRDLASALDRVAADVADVLALWPAPVGVAGRAMADPITCFAGGSGGGLVQVSGRSATRPPRRGAVGPLEGRRIYAVGDVHGCYDLLIALLRQLAEDATQDVNESEPRPTSLIFLGDYVDRGPDSARVLEALALLKAQAAFEVCLLKGNHEDALLRFLDAPEGAAPWLGFGGAATLASYGVEPPESDASPRAFAEAREALLHRMPAAHLRLLQDLPLMAIVGDFAFVHAGVAPGEPLRRQRARDLMWIRREFLDAGQPFEKVIVHGHTWTGERPAVTPTRIGLDTGAYETGVLSAMRFEDEGRMWIPVRRGEATSSWTPAARPLNFTA